VAINRDLFDQLVVEILDDDHGISMDAWDILYRILHRSGDPQDILTRVRNSDGRVYLPEDWEN
jgi:hypothetical protein